MGRDMVQIGMQPEELGGGEPVVEAKMLRQEARPLATGRVAQPNAEQATFSAGSGNQPEEHFYGGGFTGAVGTEESKDLAALDCQGEIGNGNLVAELLAQAADLNGGRGICFVYFKEFPISNAIRASP